VAKELIADLGVHHGVAVMHWPRDAGHVEQLARLGLPRLLLVSRGGGRPADNGPLQDWLWWPNTRQELHRRLLGLYQRAEQRRAGRSPSVDGAGRVRIGDGCLRVSSPEQKLAEVLVARFEEPVAEDKLLRMAEGPCSRASLRARLARLCEDLKPLGLEVAPAGGDTYVLRHCADPVVRCAA
jgi:hypothetical protein